MHTEVVNHNEFVIVGGSGSLAVRVDGTLLPDSCDSGRATPTGSEREALERSARGALVVELEGTWPHMPRDMDEVQRYDIHTPARA